MKKVVLSSLVYSVLFFLLATLTPKPLNAQALLFQDDFEDENLIEWYIIGGTWSIKDFQGSKWLAASAPPYSSYEIQTGSFSWSDYELTLDFSPLSGVDRNIFFRVKNERSTGLPGHDLPVAYGLHLTNRLVELQKWTSNSGQLLKSTSYSFSTSEIYHFKILVNSNNIKIYVNNFSTPIINYTDTDNPISSGRIALALITGDSGSEAFFDNVTVKMPPNILDVPDIKQYHPPWSLEIYDNASSWSTDPTISRWGCALTSASMILKYYGYDYDPHELNNWLNSQLDGYIRNGLLNWLAVARYTRLNTSDDRPTLEFRRYVVDSVILENEINSERPPILKLPGHFLVAKGKVNSDFLVNDPASTKSLLSQVEEDRNINYSAIYSYLPSTTDLSYIMLIIDGGFDVKVSGPDEKEIVDHFFVEEPILDHPDRISTSGEQIGVFMLPKPQEGKYSLEVTGNGLYRLDSYFYDEEGKAQISSFKDIVSEESKDSFLMSFGQNSYIENVVSIDSLIEDWEVAYSHGFIYNRTIYSSIRDQLIFTKSFSQRGRPYFTKIMLNSILTQIEFYTPRFIEKTISHILQNNIRIFISKL